MLSPWLSTSDAGLKLGEEPLAFDPREVSPAQLISRIAAKHAIQDLFVEHPPIERIIAELYAKHGEIEA